MTDREAPPNWRFDTPRDDPFENDGWFGREQPGTEAPFATTEVIRQREPVTPARERRINARHDVAIAATPPASTVNGQLRAAHSSALTFRAPPQPWYRTKQAGIALLATAATAVIVSIVVFAWPDNSSPAPDPTPSTSVPPPPSAAQPSPSTAAPAPINLPPPPPAPPPENTGSAPTYNAPNWTPEAPEPAKGPSINVTRAPISVAPVPRLPPKVDTGDSNKPGCGGWC